ncbi:MAG: hypothetical protein RLZZ522_1608 [Verrucomicrobiota bacterium]
MNKRQVALLWLVAIALGGVIAYVKFGQQQTAASHTTRAVGDKLLDKFPATEVATIDLSGAGDKAVTLTKKDGKWTVAQREDYPANVTTVNAFLRTLEELKVTHGIQAGPSFAPRFGLDETATTADKRGLTATFKDAAGTQLAKVSIDQRKAPENPASPYGGGPNGRFVRVDGDDSGIYRVSESFASLSNDPKSWVAQDFVTVEKIKAVSVTEADKPETAWKLTRETEEGQFVLDGAAPGETLDTTATDPLKSLLSYARIDDVIPAAKVAERVQGAGKRIATIETFEGFVYTLTFTPLKPSTAPPATPDPNNPMPPATDNFAVSIAVAAELPKERKKAADEKPEDAKAKDTAFTERLKTLTERLAKEKQLAGRTFEVSKYTVDSLLKDRAALIKKPDATAPGAGQPMPMPTGPLEAVTPPIAVPPVPENTEPQTAEEPPASKPKD